VAEGLGNSVERAYDPSVEDSRTSGDTSSEVKRCTPLGDSHIRMAQDLRDVGDGNTPLHQQAAVRSA